MSLLTTNNCQTQAVIASAFRWFQDGKNQEQVDALCWQEYNDRVAVSYIYEIVELVYHDFKIGAANFRAYGLGSWLSYCRTYKVWADEDGTGEYHLGDEYANKYIGSGTKKEMMELAVEYSAAH